GTNRFPESGLRFPDKNLRQQRTNRFPESGLRFPDKNLRQQEARAPMTAQDDCRSASCTFRVSSRQRSASASLRATLDIIRQASERRMTPSSRMRRWLARKVEPVEVMSTMISAEPAAGAPSVAPRLSTIR